MRISTWFQRSSSFHAEPFPCTTARLIPHGCSPAQNPPRNPHCMQSELPTYQPSMQNSPLSDPDSSPSSTLLSRLIEMSDVSHTCPILSPLPVFAQVMPSTAVSLLYISTYPSLQGDAGAGHPFRSEPSLLWLSFVSFLWKLASSICRNY